MTHNRGARVSRTRKVLAAGAVGMLCAAGVVIGGTPASAAGETSATALSLALDADLDVGPVAAALVSANGRVGHVTAPSSEGTNKRSVGTLTASGTAVDGRVSVGALTATRTDIGTRSSAQLVGANVDALAEDLVTTGDVESSAMCPVGASPAVQSNVVGLKVLGESVNLNAGSVTVDANASLGITGLTDAKVVATVSSPRSVGSSSASVTAVRIDAKLVADVLGAPVTVDLGHVDIGTSRCATPSAVDPSALAIDPNRGPSSGGQTVTITGDAFVPGDTSVEFGGTTVPASRVDVNDNGTSLTLVTPPHAPGLVDVTVTTPGGTDGPLNYTFVGEGVTAPGGGTNGGGDDGDDTVTGTEGDDNGGVTGANSGSVVPASQTVDTGDGADSGLGGLLAQTGPLGLVSLALLALVMIVGGGMLAKHASERPGLAENPWVHPEE